MTTASWQEPAGLAAPGWRDSNSDPPLEVVPGGGGVGGLTCDSLSSWWPTSPTTRPPPPCCSRSAPSATSGQNHEGVRHRADESHHPADRLRPPQADPTLGPRIFAETSGWPEPARRLELSALVVHPGPRVGSWREVALLGAMPAARDLCCERKHRHRMTSSDAAIVPLTLASCVVACRLLLSGCRLFAACSPPMGSAHRRPSGPRTMGPWLGCHSA